MNEEQYVLPEEYEEWEAYYYGSYDLDYDYFFDSFKDFGYY